MSLFITSRIILFLLFCDTILLMVYYKPHVPAYESFYILFIKVFIVTTAVDSHVLVRNDTERSSVCTVSPGPRSCHWVVSYCYVFVLTRSHMFQAGFKFAIQLRMALNFCPT